MSKRVHWADHDDVREIPRRLNPLARRLGPPRPPKSRTLRVLRPDELAARAQRESFIRWLNASRHRPKNYTR